MREFISVGLTSVAAYLTFWSGYDFFLAVCALFSKKHVFEESEDEFFYLVIPAYKEGEILIRTIETALKVEYPTNQREVILLAQDLDSGLLATLRQFPITIIETGALGSKMNAIKNWINSFDPTNEHLFILDADNLIHKHALKICSAALKSTNAVQLEREKTEPDTPLAVLDHWNTSVGITLSLHGRLSLGLSPFVLGSGFAVKASLYKRFVNAFENTNVEDKALDLFLIQEGERLKYLRTPGVIDSTIARSAELETQRSRWVGGRIEARNIFRRAHLHSLWNIELLDKHLHYSAPQRSIRLAISAVWGALILLFPENFILILPILLGGTSVILATPKSLFSKRLFNSILALPKSIFIIIKSRLFAKGASTESFKRTPK